MRTVRLSVVFFSTIVIYVVFHITEETLGNFPLFMHQNWGIPDIGYARWLYHNVVFFLPVLLLAFMLFLGNEKKFFSFGLAIPFWGVLNFLEHTFYSIKNADISAGFFSSLLFVAVTFLAVYTAKEKKELTGKRTVLAMGLAVLYWAISILLVFLLSGKVAGIFS